MHTKLRITGNDGIIRYEFLQHGQPGTVQTLREMAALVRNDVLTDEGLQDYANKILVAAGVASDVYGRGSAKEIGTIFKFVRDRFLYRKDPTGGSEAIQDARVSIQRAYGDCDDFAVLLATLLGLVGYVCRFVVVRVDAQSAGFQHVYVEVLNTKNNRWYALDATNRHALVGWEARSIERRTFQIFGSHPSNELEGFKSAFKKIGKGIKKVGKAAAPIAVGFIPAVGQFASQGVSAAFDAIDAKSARKQQQQQQQEAQAAYEAQAGAVGQHAPQQPGGSAGVSPTILIAGGAGLIALLALMKS